MRPTCFTLLATIICAAALCGCAAHQEKAQPPTSSIQTIEYFPYEVKGYQGTYPKRRVAVLAASDARDFKDAPGVPHTPEDGHPAIGVVEDSSGRVEERLYGPALDSLVQQAIARAAQEAGMEANTISASLKDELAARNADYIVSSKIERCWVQRVSGPDKHQGSESRSTATVALQVAIYKPPFQVPFWEGQSASIFDDPPLAGSVAADDRTAIYDQPGEVLSAALTRAVAGIFRRDDLHELIRQDPIRTR